MPTYLYVLRKTCSKSSIVPVICSISTETLSRFDNTTANYITVQNCYWIVASGDWNNSRQGIVINMLPCTNLQDIKTVTPFHTFCELILIQL